MYQDELIPSKDIPLCPIVGGPIHGISYAEGPAAPEYAKPAAYRFTLKLPCASALFGAAGGSAGPSEYRSRLLAPANRLPILSVARFALLPKHFPRSGNA